jgi:hypothetical protein
MNSKQIKYILFFIGFIGFCVMMVLILKKKSTDNVATCKPSCETGKCGSDGCGGTCPCSVGYKCTSGICTACTPSCETGKYSDTDGCGGTCPCPFNQQKDTSNNCISACSSGNTQINKYDPSTSKWACAKLCKEEKVWADCSCTCGRI